MTDVHNLVDHERLVRQARNEIKPGRMSKTAAARQIGVSAATLSLWLSGNYGGNVERIDKKVERWLRYQADSARLDRSSARLDAHCDFDITTEIVGTLANGHVQGDIVLVCGPSGAGKTWAATHYRDTHSATFMVQMTEAVRSISGMLRRIAVAIDAVPRDRSALAAEAAIVEALKGREALLIIDEAHHLSVPLIDELRALRDMSGCGLALIGDKKLQALVRTCPQVAGRVGASVTATAPRNDDVTLLAASVLGRQPSEGDIEQCCRAAALPGGLHTLRRMLSAAWIDAHNQDQSRISTQHLIDAVSDLTDLDAAGRDEALREAIA